MTRTCEHCTHWTAGLCCRFPPAPSTPHLTATGTSAAFRFPETKPDDHCGEWRPREPGPTFTYTVNTPDGPVDVTTNGSGFLELIERRAE